MVEYETINAEKIKFGRNNFIEVARMKAKVPGEEENIYISLRRGIYFQTEPKDTKKHLQFLKMLR